MLLRQISAASFIFKAHFFAVSAHELTFFFLRSYSYDVSSDHVIVDAIRSGQASIVKLLLEYHADVNAENG